MVAYMNAEALRRTAETGDAWFWSRSRQELWHKGATSGNYQHLVGLRLDCDADAVLLQVRPDGPACHTGAVSCFFQSLEEAMASPAEAEAGRGDSSILDEVVRVVRERHTLMPEGSYTTGLFREGIDAIAKKVGEEATETIIAAKNGVRDQIVWEVTDLWFHSLVLLEATGVPISEVWEEFARRRQG